MSDDELVQVVQEHPDRAVTASEVADQVDLTRQWVLERLNQLEKKGRVRKKQVGSRAVVWWCRGD